MQFNRRLVKSLTAATTAALVLTLAASVGTSGECDRYGTPTYVAKRSIALPGKQFVAKVFVTPDREREEVVEGKKTIVRITDPKGVRVFDDVSKSGVDIPPPKGPPPKKGDPNIRSSESSEGDLRISTLEAKGPNNSWLTLSRVVCRADGVLLEREFPVNVNGKRGKATIKHSEIEFRAVPAEVFEVPSDVKIMRAPGK